MQYYFLKQEGCVSCFFWGRQKGMLPHGTISCGVCVDTSTYTCTHTHKQMLLDLRRKISAARVTSPLYNPRYLAKVSLPMSNPVHHPCLGHSQLPPTSPNALGYAQICTRTVTHASNPWYEHMSHLFSHHTHSLVFLRCMPALPPLLRSPCSRAAADDDASLPHLFPLFAAPQGFEQLAFGLWELFKISGNRPASHHLLIPRIRDL